MGRASSSRTSARTTRTRCAWPARWASSRRWSEGFRWAARYERGVRHPLDMPASLTRDAASVFGQLAARERFRVDGRAELRREEGTPVRGAPVPVDRLQAVVALAAEALLREDLTPLRPRELRPHPGCGAAGAAAAGGLRRRWRGGPGPFLVVARYSVTRELLPGERGRVWRSGAPGPLAAAGGAAGRSAARWRRACTRAARAWGARVRVGVDRHAAALGAGGGGLETAVEVARRGCGARGCSAECRCGPRWGTGWTKGCGSPQATHCWVSAALGCLERRTDESNRLYLRAEVAY